MLAWLVRLGVQMSDDIKALAQRLARIESRLVQLMIHLGLDPYAQTYEAESPITQRRMEGN